VKPKGGVINTWFKKSDSDLMAFVRYGNSEAFRALYLRYIDRVLNSAGRYLGRDSALIEDIAQTVWINVVNNSHKFDVKKPFPNWLMGITRNASLNALRSIRTRKEAGFETVEGISSQDKNESFENIEEELIHRMEVRALRTYIDLLPDRQRDAIVTLFAQDLSRNELAEQLGVAPSAAKMLIASAKRMILKIHEKEMKSKKEPWV
jgi:RNA polymerase sigma factor (sigma-70 family)